MKYFLLMLLAVGCAKPQDGPTEAELEAGLPSCSDPDKSEPQVGFRIFYELSPNDPTVRPPFRFICKTEYTDSNGIPRAGIIFAKTIENTTLDGYIYLCPNLLDGTCYKKAKVFVK